MFLFIQHFFKVLCSFFVDLPNNFSKNFKQLQRKFIEVLSTFRPIFPAFFFEFPLKFPSAVMFPKFLQNSFSVLSTISEIRYKFFLNFLENFYDISSKCCQVLSASLFHLHFSEISPKTIMNFKILRGSKIFSEILLTCQNCNSVLSLPEPFPYLRSIYARGPRVVTILCMFE